MKIAKKLAALALAAAAIFAPQAAMANAVLLLFPCSTEHVIIQLTNTGVPED